MSKVKMNPKIYNQINQKKASSKNKEDQKLIKIQTENWKNPRKIFPKKKNKEAIGLLRKTKDIIGSYRFTTYILSIRKWEG